MSVRILIGECRERLRDLPEGSVHCVVTSPPYYLLRDYRVSTSVYRNQGRRPIETINLFVSQEGYEETLRASSMPSSWSSQSSTSTTVPSRFA